MAGFGACLCEWKASRQPTPYPPPNTHSHGPLVGPPLALMSQPEPRASPAACPSDPVLTAQQHGSIAPRTIGTTACKGMQALTTAYM